LFYYDKTMLDLAKSLPEDPEDLRWFTALLLAEVKSQALLIAKLQPADEEPDEEKNKPKRRPIPDHIPRMEVELTTGDADCAQCGGTLRRLGEDVTEELEDFPGRFVAPRIVRPRFTCSGCESFTQAPLPSRPI
jgi:transposase